jgi:DNA polymerase alpha-associated DNA helicase A
LQDNKKGTDRRYIREEIARLRKEVKERERKTIRSILLEMDVVLATCTGADSRHLELLGLCQEHPFDLVVIDEAAQALEAACWIPIFLGKKVILAGGKRPELTVYTKKQVNYVHVVLIVIALLATATFF